MQNNFLEFEKDRHCLLCGSEEKFVLSNKMQFRLDCTTVICKGCGFCFVSPAPKREAYSAFYQQAYAKFYKSIHPERPVNQVVRESAWDKKQLDLLESFKPLHSAVVLEIGPGRGRFLKLVSKRGANVCAIEPSSEFRTNLEQSDINIIGDFLENTITDQKFDIIMLFQVLEHFHDPVDAVLRIKNILAPGGIVVLDVPNIWKPFRSLDRYFLRYVHLSYFSPQTLKHLMAKHGFEALLIDESGKSIVRHNPLFAIFQKNESTVENICIYNDDWRSLVKHLKRYRMVHFYIYAPIFHTRRLLLNLRKILAQSVIGDIYRHFKILIVGKR